MLRPRLHSTYAEATTGARLQSPAHAGVMPLRHENPARKDSVYRHSSKVASTAWQQ